MQTNEIVSLKLGRDYDAIVDAGVHGAVDSRAPDNMGGELPLAEDLPRCSHSAHEDLSANIGAGPYVQQLDATDLDSLVADLDMNSSSRVGSSKARSTDSTVCSNRARSRRTDLDVVLGDCPAKPISKRAHSSDDEVEQRLNSDGGCYVGKLSKRPRPSKSIGIEIGIYTAGM